MCEGLFPVPCCRRNRDTDRDVVTQEGELSMKITRIETYTVSVDWKNWLFVKVLTDDGVSGLGEATMNGFIKTTEAAIHVSSQ